MSVTPRVRVGLIQLNAGEDPAANLRETMTRFRAAVAGGARFVLTPEMTNAISSSRVHQRAVFRREAEDPTLAALRDEAAAAGVWLLIGSLGLIAEDEADDGRFANRSFLIGPDGAIAARYDKIHMFDVDLDNGESWRESSAYEPGVSTSVVDTGNARIGLAICYDLRFPQLFRAQALAGANMLTVPAAFTRQTGEVHWHVLLRARAIENGAWVVAAAQGGRHEDGRETYGHSLIVDPWGRIAAEVAGDEPGMAIAEIDIEASAAARRKVPNLKNAREFKVVAAGGGSAFRGAAS